LTDQRAVTQGVQSYSLPYHRIEVAFKPGQRDALGDAIARRVKDDLGIATVRAVRTVDVYSIDAQLSKDALENLAKEVFADPVIQDFSVDRPIAANYDWLVEVGFKPGVTDNVGKTSKEAIAAVLRAAGPDVYTSRQYLFTGSIPQEDVVRIARGLLANELIERWLFVYKGKPLPNIDLPVVRLEHEPEVREFDLRVSDAQLEAISSRGLLALSLEEMKAVQSHYADTSVIARRKAFGLSEKATDVELEAIAGTWSEHCKHKIFNAVIDYEDADANRLETITSLFDTCVKAATEKLASPFLVSVFKDNAGIIKFNDAWSVAMKVETHNSPSALDPYGGALTGIVGVNRDILGCGLGAKLIFNTDVFAFASPFWKGDLPPRILHPRRVFEGVRKGVQDGGNKSGIPTVNGSIIFDERFLARPLVYCGTAGLLPAKLGEKPSHEKTAKPGDAIVVIGGRVGKDGIHGATFSSLALGANSPATAVQLGDPITQKRVGDFLMEARGRGLYDCITDNGAGGISGSVGEMARSSGGAELHLDRAPLKYPGLDPWEIFLSESQERMTCSVPQARLKEFLDLAEKRNVEASVLGTFDDSGWFKAFFRGKPVGLLDMKFWHDGVPRMRLKARWAKPQHPEPQLDDKKDYSDDLRKVLGRLNVCSKEYVVRQYDHEVQGGSAVKPLVGAENDGPSDAAVVRPLLDSFEGVVTAHGVCPKFGDIDAFQMAANAIDEALRNYISVGGRLDHVAGLDNFCWPDPTRDPFKAAQLVRANKALFEACTAYGVPLVSGKDSMKNDYVHDGKRLSIPPTLLFTVIGKIDDVRRVVTMDAKKAGDLVYAVGVTRPELGAGEYLSELGFVGNSVPTVRPAEAKPVFDALSKAIASGLVASCHDVSDGGLAVALAETAFAGSLGVDLDLSRAPMQDVSKQAELLFSESPSRFVVTVHPSKKREFLLAMQNVPCAEVGIVTMGSRFVLRGLRSEKLVDVETRALKDAWQVTMRW
jgi:phosphoribosylformylglycinamidine synthase